MAVMSKVLIKAYRPKTHCWK